MKDKGAGHFTDFEHLVNIYVNSFPFGNYGGCGVWGITNGNYTEQDMITNNEGIICRCYNTGTTKRIYIRSYDNAGVNDQYTGVSDATNYYLTIERATNTLTCKIYSDAGRTTLIDTLSITSNADAKRYIGGFIGEKFATYVDHTITIDVENLDLQEVTPTTGKKIPNYFNADFVPCDA